MRIGAQTCIDNETEEKEGVGSAAQYTMIHEIQHQVAIFFFPLIFQDYFFYSFFFSEMSAQTKKNRNISHRSCQSDCHLTFHGTWWSTVDDLAAQNAYLYESLCCRSRKICKNKFQAWQTYVKLLKVAFPKNWEVIEKKWRSFSNSTVTI